MGARTSLKPTAGINRHYTKAWNAWGWNVRIGYRGKVYSKYFADRKHGGKKAALNLAKEWRYRTLIQLMTNGEQS